MRGSDLEPCFFLECLFLECLFLDGGWRRMSQPTPSEAGRGVSDQTSMVATPSRTPSEETSKDVTKETSGNMTVEVGRDMTVEPGSDLTNEPGSGVTVEAEGDKTRVVGGSVTGGLSTGEKRAGLYIKDFHQWCVLLCLSLLFQICYIWKGEEPRP